MPKGPEITDFEHGMIIGLHKGGFGSTKINEILRFPRTTIDSIIKKYKENKMTTVAQRSGRPPLLNDCNKRSIIRIIKKDRQQSLGRAKSIFRFM